MAVTILLPQNKPRQQRRRKTVPPITTNPQRLGGTPVIGVERLPVEQLIGYLLKGGTVDEFIDEFGAERENVLAALRVVA